MKNSLKTHDSSNIDDENVTVTEKKRGGMRSMRRAKGQVNQMEAGERNVSSV